MKIGFRIALIAGMVIIISTGCEKKQESTINTSTPSEQIPTTSDAISGAIAETMNAGGYTYFLINTGSEKIWGAVTQRDLPIGLDVSFGQSMKMTNFRSETLDKTFETIYFVENLLPGKGPKTMSTEMVKDQMNQAKQHTQAPSFEDIDFSDLSVPEDGMKVVDIFDKKNDFENKMVRLRGKVVKFVAGVMGKNWIHIQDGSGTTGTNDITVTCDETVTVGDLVSVEGTLTLNKDFGFGYKYDVIIENALVIKE